MLIACLLLLPMVCAPLAFFLGQRRDGWEDSVAALTCLAELFLSLALLRAPASLSVPGILPGDLSFSADGFQTTYALVAALMWLGTTLFSREYFRRERENLPAYWMFVLLTLGATEGVFLSADFLTAFVFFEILSLTSFTWVVHERTAEAIRAGVTYLAIAVIGGLAALMGLLLLQNAAGTLTYAALDGAVKTADPRRVFAAGVCILLGFGAKAGMFPLHVWLPKAHPVAPAPASALLSGMLTKVGVFGILMTVLHVLPDSRPFGCLVLGAGLVTMVLGAVLAVFSVNLKRTLACSSMSQIGFILTGLGCAVLLRAHGAEEALSGALAHMVNHSLLKLVLFLCAGAVAMNLHALDLNDIRGWGRNKPALMVFFAIAAGGISGVPGLNGYLSKTMLHEGLTHLVALEGGWALPAAEWVFLLSGGLTFAYMLKLFVCLFVEKNSDGARQAAFDRSGRCMTPLSTAVLGAGTALLVILGKAEAITFLTARMSGTALPSFAPMSWESLRGAAVSLAAGGCVYVLFVRRVLLREGRYVNLWPERLDLENGLYRPLLLHALPAAGGELARFPGENRVLRPLFVCLEALSAVLGRVLDTGTDALILLLRRSLIREEKVRDGSSARRLNRRRILEQATAEALSPIVENFSFAMLMTCGGIILILGALLVLLL